MPPHPPSAVGQILDAGNTKVVGMADASPGSPWVGAWRETRNVSIVQQLTTLASNVPSGLGGTFRFEYSEDGINPTITVSTVMRSFAFVRRQNPINAGAYYRVKFEPSRPLLAGEFVFLMTVQNTQYNGAFIYAADAILEQENFTADSVFAYLKTFDKNGNSRNLTSSVNGLIVDEIPVTLGVSAIGAVGASAVATLPPVVGKFLYLCGREIYAFRGVAGPVVGGPYLVTTTNLPGNPVFPLFPPQGVGGADRYITNLTRPLRTNVAGVPTVFTCPAVAGINWSVNIFYFLGD